MIWDADQWEYIGEGGKHAIFAFINSDVTSSTTGSTFHNKVLRIPKEVFCIKDYHVSINIDMNVGDPNKTRTNETKKSYNRQDFQLFFMKALFCAQDQEYPHIHCNYLDEPVEVEFELKTAPTKQEEIEIGKDDDDDDHHHFLANLREHALRSEKIPPSRMKDWTSKESDNHDYPIKFQGYILPNYRNQYGKTNVLSIELKPKAGYIASSPLVHPNHRIKYTRSRFQILQQLAQDGVIKKGWCNDNNNDCDNKDYKMSTYDPLDLFPINYHRGAGRLNGDNSRTIRTRRAIESLFKNPQNNLKVFYGHNMLYGHVNTEFHADGYSLSHQNAHHWQHEESAAEALESFFGIEKIGVNDGECHSDLSFLGHKLQNILCDILIQDKFLEYLQNYQRALDLLDVDGATLVYNRLVSLMKDASNGNILAEKLIEHTLIDIPKHQEETSPERTTSMEEDIRRIVLSNNFFHGIDLSIYDNSFFDGIKGLENDTGTANWTRMFHRTENISAEIRDDEYKRMKEIVDNLEQLECVRLLQMWLLSLSLNDISFFVIISAEEENEKDRIPRKTIQTRCGRRLTYEIKVADYDCKPAKKLRNKEKSERVMAHFNSNE